MTTFFFENDDYSLKESIVFSDSEEIIRQAFSYASKWNKIIELLETVFKEYFRSKYDYHIILSKNNFFFLHYEPNFKYLVNLFHRKRNVK